MDKPAQEVTPMGDKTRGLYDKFVVTRTDGTSAEGGKHHECQYFVLDIDHDPHAKAALLAYADSCKADYPLLANDVRALAILAPKRYTDSLTAPGGYSCPDCGMKIVVGDSVCPKTRKQHARPFSIPRKEEST